MPAFVEAMSVKTDEEMQNVAAACEIAEKALDKLYGELKEGDTENEVAARLEYYMRAFGAGDRSFETIAAFGKNSSVPHHAPDDTKLEKGMPVLLDFGCKVGGYCSDITRTCLFGKSADDHFAKIYAHVYDAHMNAAEHIRAGMSGHEADALARGVLEKQGLESSSLPILWGTGSASIFTNIPPYASGRTGTLKDDMVFSIEPGVYFEENSASASRTACG